MNAFPDDPAPIQPSEPYGVVVPARESISEGDIPCEDISREDLGHSLVPSVAGPGLPSWWDVFVLVVLTVLSVVFVVISMVGAVLIAKKWIYPQFGGTEIARMPLVLVSGQAAGYLLVLGCMYLLVTRVQHRPDFLNAIHWNWPSSPAVYIAGGVVLSIALQVLASRLPVPKNLPIDTFFRTPAEAWALTIFGITLAPLMEELFFRGFLYPVLARGLGMTSAIFITAFAFALLHGSQLMYSWGPVLVIFLVGVVLTMVRARKNSVAAGMLVHIAYNGTISALMFVATDGFRHLEKLNQ